MDWASNLFIALLLTDITGSVFFIAGVLIKKWLSDDAKLLRFLMKATLYAYLVPFVFIIIYLNKRVSTIKMESNINLFYNTPVILRVNAVLGCVWFGLFLVLLAHKLYRRSGWAKLCEGNIPEEDERVFEVFNDVCAGLEIDGEVSLCRNDSVKTPCITYHHGFVVVLPLVHYTEEEARIIFYHELCHYLNGDIYLKTVSSIAALMHVFNPLVHILLDRMDMVCERYCDRAACEKGMSIFTDEEYFQTIFDLSLSEGKKEKYQLFALADDKSHCERRVEYMLSYHKHGGLKKGAMVALSAAFLLGSSITSLAAGGGVVAVYEGLAEKTSVKADETNIAFDNADEEAFMEFARAYDLDPEDVVMMGEDGIETQADSFDVTWTVPAGKTYMTGGFTQQVGDTVAVMVVGDPDDITFQAGIKDPKQIMRYAEGVGYVNHEFEIKIKGRHYFFISNLDEERDLHIEAFIARIPKEEIEEEP